MVTPEKPVAEVADGAAEDHADTDRCDGVRHGPAEPREHGNGDHDDHDDRQRQARADAERGTGVVGQNEHERPDQVDGPRGEPRDGERLGHLVGDQYGERDHDHHANAPGTSPRLAGDHSPGGAGPALAGRVQRFDSPPLLQSMHSRA